MNRRLHAPAFTLLEMLVSMTITSILLTLMVQIMGTTQQTWQRTKSQAEAFRSAREAFESISRQLSQATLNNYWDYNDPNQPTYYQRQSELHYVSGPASSLLTSMANPTIGHSVFFQAPLGVDHLDPATQPGAGLDQALNAWGYYVEYNSDLPTRPGFMTEASPTHPEKKRFRLMEFRLPSENFDLFKLPTTATAGTRPALHAATTASGLYSWFRTPLQTRSEPLAENILALIIRPTFPGQSTQPDDYLYDTRSCQLTSGNISDADAARRHQLPPAIRIVLVALDESSWLRTEHDEALSTELVNLVNNELFTRPAKLEDDLIELSATLTSMNLQHRVFNTTVSIRAAKWHTEKQKNPTTTP